MRISKAAVVSCVLLIFSIYATTEATTPVWKKQYEVGVSLKIVEGDQLLSVPVFRCLSDSGQETGISMGIEMLVGDGEKIGEQILGYEASIVVNSIGDERFHIACCFDWNTLAEVRSEMLHVVTRSFKTSCVAQVGKEHTIGGLVKKERPGWEAIVKLTEARPAGWVNLTPVSVAGKSLSAESILQGICEQAGLKLGIDGMDAKTKENIQRKPIISLTDVPFERALRALGDHCGFEAFYFKDEGVCHIRLPK